MKNTPRSVVICVLALAALAGCGEQTYQRRFDETKKYFAYLDRLNESLSRTTWTGQGVQLRVPKQFQLINPPAESKSPAEAAASKEAGAEESAAPHDPRQPPFFESPLPGLQGAWQGDVGLAGETIRLRAYLYVLSNYELLGKKGFEEQAAGFSDEVLRLLATAAGQPVPTADKLTLLEVPKGPKGDAYVNKLNYKIVTPAFPVTIDGKPYRIEVFDYLKEKSPAQVCIVLVAPDNVAPAEKLDRAMNLSLETLQVTQDRPPQVAIPGGPSKGKGPTGI